MGVLKNIRSIMIFIIFTFILNTVIEDYTAGLLIGVRLMFACNATYIVSQTFTYIELAETIELLCEPLKIFKINPKDIGLIMCIAITFMPILKNELKEIRNNLKVKAVKYKRGSIIENLTITLKVFFISLLEKVDELAITLKIKGYEE